MQLSPALVALGLATALPSAGLGCGIALDGAGTLAPSGDYTRLGSSELGGVPATIIVSNGVLGGDFTVTIGAPTLVAAPAQFNQGSAALSVAYSGVGLLGYVSQAYTGGATHFDVSGLLGALAVVVTIHNRIVNPAGFAAGTYQTRTVVTCS